MLCIICLTPLWETCLNLCYFIASLQSLEIAAVFHYKIFWLRITHHAVRPYGNEPKVWMNMQWSICMCIWRIMASVSHVNLYCSASPAHSLCWIHTGWVGEGKRERKKTARESGLERVVNWWVAGALIDGRVYSPITEKKVELDHEPPAWISLQWLRISSCAYWLPWQPLSNYCVCDMISFLISLYLFLTPLGGSR